MPLPWHFPLLGSNGCGDWPPLQPVADGVAQLGTLGTGVEAETFALVLVPTSTGLAGIFAADIDVESRVLSPLAITKPLTKANTTSTATVATIHQVLREPLRFTLPFARRSTTGRY